MSQAEEIFDIILLNLKLVLNEDPYNAINQGLENIRPLFIMRKLKVAGTLYKLPFNLLEKKAYGLLARSLIKAAKEVSSGNDAAFC